MTIEHRFGPLGNEIIEEVYISEVMAAIEECMQLFDNRCNPSPTRNRLFINEELNLDQDNL